MVYTDASVAVANDRSGNQINSRLIEHYRDVFVTVENFEEWTYDDILNNGLQQADRIPPSVEEYEQMLGMKRKVPNNVFSLHLCLIF